MNWFRKMAKTFGAIAPPGQEGWREAPGWLFNQISNRPKNHDKELEQPPRLRLRRSHPSCPEGAIAGSQVCNAPHAGGYQTKINSFTASVTAPTTSRSAKLS